MSGSARAVRTVSRLAIVGLAVLWILPGWASAGSIVAPSAPLASSPDGAVNVAVADCSQTVELSRSSTPSLSSQLSVDEVAEVSNGPNGPTVVEVAFPDVLCAPPGASPQSYPVVVNASLLVYPAEAALWNGPEGEVTPDGGPIGHANLTVEYSLAPAGSAGPGVSIDWNLIGWPWRSASDLVGIELGLTSGIGAGLIACGSSPLVSTSSGCPGSTLSEGATSWASTAVGVQYDTGSNTSIGLAWSPTVTGSSSTGDLPVTIGLQDQSPTFAHILLAAPALGAQRIGGSVDFALLTYRSPIPLTIHGEAGWFAGAAAGFAIASLVTIAGYRRHQRSIEAAL